MAFEVKNRKTYIKMAHELKMQYEDRKENIDIATMAIITTAVLFIWFIYQYESSIFCYFFSECTFWTFVTSVFYTAVIDVFVCVACLFLVDYVFIPLVITLLYEVLFQFNLRKIKNIVFKEKRQYLDETYQAFLNYTPDKKLLRKKKG
jgi:hypothetical protein